MDITNKSEVLDYITKHNREHGGCFTTERGFKKHFTELYSIFKNTNFPPFFKDFDFKQKLWHFLRDDYEQRICKCGGLVKFRNFWYGYNDFCRQNCPSMVENQKQKLNEYNEHLTEEERKRKKLLKEETTYEHYGVKYYAQTKEWKDKTIKRNKEKYGTDWFSQTDKYKNKYKKTSIEKYGVENPMLSDDVRSKWKKLVDTQTQDYWFKKYPNIISINGTTLLCKCCDESCKLCEEKVFEIDKQLFSNRTCYGIDTCTIRTPYNGVSSGKENELLNYIKTIYSGRIIENDRDILYGKELDIYLPELKLAFEFNGVYWHCEHNKPIKYHQQKSLICLKKGIRLIHIWEDDWTHKNEILKEFIKSKFGLFENIIDADRCETHNVDEKTAETFLNSYHIKGCVKNEKFIGLFYNDELVEVMSFGMSEKSTNPTPVYEIYEVCTKSGYNVQNGFSKLLEHIEDTYKPGEMVIYADLDYSVGNTYKKCGFIKEYVDKPAPTWVINGIRYHDLNFIKSKFKEFEENSKLTELEIMHNHGYWRCWDSGKIRFVKKYQ